MRAIVEGRGGTYGSPRIYQALVARGYRVSHRRVERLMRVGGWRARVVRVYRRTTGTHRWFGQHPNRIRDRQTTGPDQIWVGDLTYVSVAGRWWYQVNDPRRTNNDLGRGGYDGQTFLIIFSSHPHKSQRCHSYSPG